MKIKESDIQRQVIEYLKYQKNLYFIRNNSFAGKITRPNGSIGWVKNNKAGSPDIIVCYKGLFIGLEIKVKGGKQTELQKQAQADIIKAGGIYKIVRSIDDIDFLI